MVLGIAVDLGSSGIAEALAVGACPMATAHHAGGVGRTRHHARRTLVGRQGAAVAHCPSPVSIDVVIEATTGTFGGGRVDDLANTMPTTRRIARACEFTCSVSDEARGAVA